MREEDEALSALKKGGLPGTNAWRSGSDPTNAVKVIGLPYQRTGFYFSIGRISTGTDAFSLKLSASAREPIPLPTCMGIAILGLILAAAPTASSAVIT